MFAWREHDETIVTAYRRWRDSRPTLLRLVFGVLGSSIRFICKNLTVTIWFALAQWRLLHPIYEAYPLEVWRSESALPASLPAYPIGSVIPARPTARSFAAANLSNRVNWRAILQGNQTGITLIAVNPITLSRCPDFPVHRTAAFLDWRNDSIG